MQIGFPLAGKKIIFASRPLEKAPENRHDRIKEVIRCRRSLFNPQRSKGFLVQIENHDDPSLRVGLVDEEVQCMAKLIAQPTVIQAAGNKPKKIEEFIGGVNSQTDDLSIARMTSPAGWIEPGQTPEFDEYTVVLRGALRVETRTETIDITAGQAIIVKRSEWVRYSTPDEGAEYIAVCLPAFSPGTVHRDVD